jgi:hypothetical protein
MARGKHETQALRTRYEALLAVVDDLTEKNAELKIRTRRVEAEAATAPGLRLRVAELEKQVQTSETPVLESLRARHKERVADLEALIGECVQFIMSSDEANRHLEGYRLQSFLVEGMDARLRADYGLVFSAGQSLNRQYRRAQAFRRCAVDAGDLERQDNLRPKADNMNGYNSPIEVLARKRVGCACGLLQSINGDSAGCMVCRSTDKPQGVAS